MTAARAASGGNRALVITGLILIIFGVIAFGAPWAFLEFITIWVGAGFLLSGVGGIFAYSQQRGASGWSLVMALLDIVLGVMFILHPFAFAGFLPWLLGIAFILFGLMEVSGSMPFAQLVPESRVIMVISGVASVVLGILFIIEPASFAMWVAIFAIVRGVTLMAVGLTAR